MDLSWKAEKVKRLRVDIDKILWLVLGACIASEILVFVFTPKFAYMQGLLESWYAKNGLIFYRDMANAYLPFLKFLMHWYHIIFGFTVISSVLLAPVTSIGLLILIFVTSRKILGGWYGMIPLIFFEIWNNYLGGNQFSTTLFLGLLLYVTFIVWLHWWRFPNRVSAMAFGLLSGFSVLTLQIVAPFIVALCFFAFLRSIKIGKVNHFLLISVGVLTPFALVLDWALRHNILDSFLYWNFFYYFGGYPYLSLGKDLSSVIVFLAVHSPLLVLFLALQERKGDFPKYEVIISALILMACFWFAVFHPMRFQISLPIMALILGIGAKNLLSRKRSFVSNFVIGLVVGINLLAVTYYLIPHYQAVFSFRNTGRIVSEVYPGDPMYDTVGWVKRNTSESSKIFVLGDTYFYLASGRLPANYRSALGVEPIIFYPLSKFQKEIDSSPPDYWVIDERLFLTYSNWGQDQVSKVIKNFLSCRRLIEKFDYWAIYGESLQTSSCVNND